MTSVEYCQELARLVASKVRAEQYEVIIVRNSEALTRFANSSIHQNVQSHDIMVRLRLLEGLRSSASSTTDISEEGLLKLSQKSQEQLDNSPDAEEPTILPSAGTTIQSNSHKLDTSEAFKEP